MNRRKLERRTENAHKLRARWMFHRAVQNLPADFEPICIGGRFMHAYINRAAVRLLDAPIPWPGGRVLQMDIMEVLR